MSRRQLEIEKLRARATGYPEGIPEEELSSEIVSFTDNVDIFEKTLSECDITDEVVLETLDMELNIFKRWYQYIVKFPNRSRMTLDDFKKLKQTKKKLDNLHEEFQEYHYDSPAQ